MKNIKYAEYVKFNPEQQRISRLNEQVSPVDYKYIIANGMVVDTTLNIGKNSQLYSINNGERFAIVMFEEYISSNVSNFPNDNTIYLVKENNRLKNALKFYSYEENYRDGVIGKEHMIDNKKVWVADNGELARIVLEGE